MNLKFIINFALQFLFGNNFVSPKLWNLEKKKKTEKIHGIKSH